MPVNRERMGRVTSNRAGEPAESRVNGHLSAVTGWGDSDQQPAILDLGLWTAESPNSVLILIIRIPPLTFNRIVYSSSNLLIPVTNSAMYCNCRTSEKISYFQ